MKENTTIVSLHRPFHSPLWVARWVCEYLYFYKPKSTKNNINAATFFLWYIYRLKKLYSKNENINEYISRKTIEEVCDYFNSFHSNASKLKKLEVILHKKRNDSIDKHIYSTYKASTYAINLAEDKLGLVAGVELTNVGKQLHFYSAPNTKIITADKVIFLRQILEKDFYFFVPYCLLQTYYKMGFDLDKAIFDFSERYYPISRFDYTHCSHDNYTKVRMQWINQLGILTENNKLRQWVRNEIQNIYSLQFDIIQKQIIEFISSKKKHSLRSARLDAMYQVYMTLLNSSEGSGYVNLYDIMTKMRMGYERFNSLLQLYYDERSRKENIFLINIIATMDVRKRFVVRGKPVMKIKIQKKL